MNTFHALPSRFCKHYYYIYGYLPKHLPPVVFSDKNTLGNSSLTHVTCTLQPCIIFHRIVEHWPTQNTVYQAPNYAISPLDVQFVSPSNSLLSIPFSTLINRSPVTTKITNFLDVTPCSLAGDYELK